MGRLCKGFTLVELVAVILILGIVSLGVVNFISAGAQVFVDVTERDRLLSEGRFVVERLNREIRQALPNSLRVAVNNGSGSHCIEFVPVLWSTYYFDLPVSPESPDSAIEVVAKQTDVNGIAAGGYSYHNGHRLLVYPTGTDDVYGDSSAHRYPLAGPPVDLADGKQQLNLIGAQRFAADSPSSRLYVTDSPVSYCANADGSIRRHANYGFAAVQQTLTAQLGNGVLMAQNLIPPDTSAPPFRVVEASLTRTASILTQLRFSRGSEQVVFSNEVHLPNAP